MISKQKVFKHEGKDVFVFKFENKHGNTAAITNYGGTVMQITVPDKDGNLADVILGFETAEEYLNNAQFFGCTVGRYANRIAKGAFVLNGKEYKLACNENPFSHLHGGHSGFDKKVWDAE